MENSLKIQLDVKNNAQELQSFMLDLNNWEEEMKKKELELSKETPPELIMPPPRNKLKKIKKENDQNHSNKPEKISAYDYTAWDKFDADKACDEIDKKEDLKKEHVLKQSTKTFKVESEKKELDKINNSDNKKELSLMDEAFYEKELGNEFVKKEQWNDAIKCYTNAINLDSQNAIYYANRSLCFIKLKNFKSAEVDATVAIQLDKTYIKAYQRRAFARLAIGQLMDAKSDYEKVLEIEPKNTLAKIEIDKINKKLRKESDESFMNKKNTFNHKDVFKNEGKKFQVKTSKIKPSISSQFADNEQFILKNEISEQNLNSLNEKNNIEKGDSDMVFLKKNTSDMKESSVFKPLPEWCKIVHPMTVPPHKRSKKPLQKINVVEIEDDEFTFQEKAVEKKSNQCIDTNVKQSSTCETDTIKSETNKTKMHIEIPKTSIQFHDCWKIVKKNSQEVYSFLKKIPGNSLSTILGNSLDSDFFSELVTFLAKDNLNDPEFIYDFLLGLAHVKRFSSMVLFMSQKDKDCVKKCVAEIKKIKTEEEILKLLKLYEMQN